MGNKAKRAADGEMKEARRTWPELGEREGGGVFRQRLGFPGLGVYGACCAAFRVGRVAP